MPIRRKKKVSKLRGKRRHGKGNIKNRRGAGNRGGRGNAGLHKHKWSYVVKYDKDRYGNRGFVRQIKKRVKTINLWEIENMIKNGDIEKKGDNYSFEFDGKVLGSGDIGFPIFIKAISFTKKAESKIKAAGGKIEKFEDKE